MLHELRLSDEAKWPLSLHDCKAAIRFLRANAQRFPLDTQRIGVVGNSAGGHLAAVMGTTNGQPEYEDLTMGNSDYSSDVQAVFVWFRVYDFPNWEADCKKPTPSAPLTTAPGQRPMFGHSLHEFPERLRDASPIYHLSQRTVPWATMRRSCDRCPPSVQYNNKGGLLHERKKDFPDELTQNCMAAAIIMASVLTLLGTILQFISPQAQALVTQLSYYAYGWTVFLALGPHGKTGDVYGN